MPPTPSFIQTIKELGLNDRLDVSVGVNIGSQAHAEPGSWDDVAQFVSRDFITNQVRGSSPFANFPVERDDYGIVSGRSGSIFIAGLDGVNRIE